MLDLFGAAPFSLSGLEPSSPGSLVLSSLEPAPDEAEVEATDKSAVFELELKAGDYDLETWMTVGKGTRGALFVYVSAK